MAGIFLAATTDKLRLVTDAAVTVDVHASFVDLASGTTTADKQNTAISTATTTDIVSAPAAATVRNVKTLTIRNKGGSTVNVTVVYSQNGTIYEQYSAKLAPGAQLTYSENGGFLTSNSLLTMPWYGKFYAAVGNGDPQAAWGMAIAGGSIAATPTNITTSVARISYFRLPQDIVVNKIRYYGVGTVGSTNYRIAIYNGDTLARILTETSFNTTANVWGEIGSGLALTLTAGQLYFIACSVNATSATAGVLCYATTFAATTGQIQVLPKSWPGNIDVDSGFNPGPAFAQGAVTTGALPDPFPTVATQAAWTGGMPLFFLDNNNA